MHFSLNVWIMFALKLESSKKYIFLLMFENILKWVNLSSNVGKKFLWVWMINLGNWLGIMFVKQSSVKSSLNLVTFLLQILI